MIAVIAGLAVLVLLVLLLLLFLMRRWKRYVCMCVYVSQDDVNTGITYKSTR